MIAGQFIFGEKKEFNKRESWIPGIYQQLLTTYPVQQGHEHHGGTGNCMVEYAGNVSGALNVIPFTDENAILSGTTASQVNQTERGRGQVTYDAAGVPKK